MREHRRTGDFANCPGIRRSGRQTLVDLEETSRIGLYASEIKPDLTRVRRPPYGDQNVGRADHRAVGKRHVDAFAGRPGDLANLDARMDLDTLLRERGFDRVRDVLV